MRRLATVLLTLGLALGASFASAAPPTCQVFCVTTQCSRDSQCMAAPGGTCNLACPKVGCCVYP
jgi:hypothetical protein